jgi:hypothetical protein
MPITTPTVQDAINSRSEPRFELTPTAVAYLERARRCSPVRRFKR